MGFFRFRRTFKLLPGVHINVSKTGPSLSIGQPGATVNLRSDRVRETVGIPGTGLSYREEQRAGAVQQRPGDFQQLPQLPSTPPVRPLHAALLILFALTLAAGFIAWHYFATLNR